MVDTGAIVTLRPPAVQRGAVCRVHHTDPADTGFRGGHLIQGRAHDTSLHFNHPGIWYSVEIAAALSSFVSKDLRVSIVGENNLFKHSTFIVHLQ